jgi:hypothetical protein
MEAVMVSTNHGFGNGWRVCVCVFLVFLYHATPPGVTVTFPVEQVGLAERHSLQPVVVRPPQPPLPVLAGRRGGQD